MDILISIGKGFLLGTSICLLSSFIDVTYSKASFIELCNENSKKYIQAIEAVHRNMMIISPLVYGLIDQTMLYHTTELQPLNILGILGIHSVGYYLVHMAMHKSTRLYTIHSFHHQYDKVLLPSIQLFFLKLHFKLVLDLQAEPLEYQFTNPGQFDLDSIHF